MERVALAESDHALGKRTCRLRAAERGLDAFLFDEVGDEVAQNERGDEPAAFRVSSLS